MKSLALCTVALCTFALLLVLPACSSDEPGHSKTTTKTVENTPTQKTTTTTTHEKTTTVSPN